MSTSHPVHHPAPPAVTARPHDWELVAGFAVGELPGPTAVASAGALEPLTAALSPLGLDHALLGSISAGVDQAVDDLRQDYQECAGCPTDRLECVNVRVLVSGPALRHPIPGRPWRCDIIRQLASSESDTLAGPCATVDVRVYQG